MPSLETLERIYWLLVWVSAIGQVLFVIMWATLPFWRTWVGRALMVKSFALGLALVVQLWFKYRAENYDPQTILVIAVSVFGLITVGILSQVVAIGYEMLNGRKVRRELKAAALLQAEHCDK